MHITFNFCLFWYSVSGTYGSCKCYQKKKKPIADFSLQIFSPYGRVEDVYLMRDELKQSRGLFSSPI